MSKLNLNRLAFFALGGLFGGMIFRWLGSLVGGLKR